MRKCRIFYPANNRNKSLEEKILALVRSNGGTKDGKWGAREKGFDCGISFKKEQFFISFKEQLKRDLAINYNKVHLS